MLEYLDFSAISGNKIEETEEKKTKRNVITSAYQCVDKRSCILLDINIAIVSEHTSEHRHFPNQHDCVTNSPELCGIVVALSLSNHFFILSFYFSAHLLSLPTQPIST